MLKKCVTFSYDDGVLQDRRLVEILNKYNLKCTFNINVGLLDEQTGWETSGVIVKRLKSNEIVKLYSGHEIASHGYTHPVISQCSTEEKYRQIVDCKEELQKLTAREIEGFAYPFGCCDDEMIAIMKKCGIKYGRIAKDSKSFDIPSDLYRWAPTIHHNDKSIFDMIECFYNLQSDDYKILNIWGHSYEFDVDDNWNHFEKICKSLSGRNDIFYGTNLELLNEVYSK